MEISMLIWLLCVYCVCYCYLYIESITCLVPGTPEYFQAIINSDSGIKKLRISYMNISTTEYQDNTTLHETCSKEKTQCFMQPGQQNVADQCIETMKCDKKAKYRTINGSCNNLDFPMRGMVGTALLRLVKASYEDDVSVPRKSVTGGPLPTPGDLRPLFPDRHFPDKVNVLNVMQWGQTISHDICHNAAQKSAKGKDITCCSGTHLPPDPSSLPKPCMPIEIPRNDTFYSQFNLTCLNFVRSTTTENLGCNLFPVQQIVTVTHFIDASFVYGSFDEIASELRTFSGGKMKDQVTSDNRHFPPKNPRAEEDCDIRSPKEACYVAGDDRVNQNPTLTVHHTILLREHNRLCEILQALNPHWNDETLYQEARRIVVAITQRITYKEFLPVILGKTYLRKLQIEDGDGEEDLKTGQYNGSINPSTINSFATAAYRSFHSLITGTVSLISERYEVDKVIKLEEHFFRPDVIQQDNNLDKFLRGMTFQPAERMDSFITEAITNNLYKSKGKYGTDLISIDIQRGRDHGLAPYYRYRKACGLPRVKNFEELSDVMTKEAINELKSKYQSVKDIDLFVGGMMESVVQGSVLGRTFQCIVGEQFKRWRNGDRFYYEFGGLPGSFTKSQVTQIRKVTLAGVFCKNGDNITKIQRNVFLRPSKGNRIIPCNQIPQMDLEPWKE